MTKQELAEKLEHLDPGATLKVDEGLLRAAFAETAASDVVAAVETFAMEHRCSFSPRDKAEGCPCFEKDDVF